MYPETTNAANYTTPYRDVVPASCLSDRVNSMLSQASETLSLLSGQHERLFGPLPARPENIGTGAKMAGPPSVADQIVALQSYLDGITHASHCIADRL